MKNTQPNYGFNKSKVNTAYEGYTPSTVGKIALGITLPSIIIAIVSVIIAVIAVPEAIIVTVVTFLISFVGSIVLMADIVIFNRKQKKKDTSPKEPKEFDIGRMVHLFLGVAVGIIIGYLIWGAQYK